MTSSTRSATGAEWPVVLQDTGRERAIRYFLCTNGLVYMTSTGRQEVLCIPRKITKDYSLTATIIDQAHAILGHFGAQKTADYIRRWYWWPRMGSEITKFCDSCGICQANETSTQRPVGLLHPLPIPNRPWGSIGMDFMGPFPESEGYDYLWVVICRLTSQVHLVPVKTTIKASELALLYVKEVVRLHGLPDSIVSDRDSKFTSKFWRETHRLLGTKLLMSTAFHPQTDGVTERANCSVGQVLRTMIRPDQRDWVEKLPMTEFALNSSISSSTGFAPFEAELWVSPHIHRRDQPHRWGEARNQAIPEPSHKQPRDGARRHHRKSCHTDTTGQQATKTRRHHCWGQQGVPIDRKPVLAQKLDKEINAQVYWAIQGD